MTSLTPKMSELIKLQTKLKWLQCSNNAGCTKWVFRNHFLFWTAFPKRGPRQRCWENKMQLMCLLSCQQKQTLLEIRYKNINWFGLCTFNPKKKTWLLKGPKCLLSSATLNKVLLKAYFCLLKQKSKLYKFPKLLRKQSKQ